MNGPCTEPAWTGTYLQIAVSVLVFGLGVPALVLQTMVSESVRDVARRRWRGGRWAQLLVLASVAISLCMVWSVPQCDVSTSWVRTLVGPLSLFTADLMISFAILGVSAIWWLQSSYRSERMIVHVEQLCRRQIATTQHVDAELIHDLVQLSGEARTCRPRMRVICSLRDLSSRLRKCADYKAGSLADIVQGIEEMSAAGGEQTLIEGLRTLRLILNEMPENADSGADVEHVVGALSRLQGFAFASASPHPLRVLLGALESVHGKSWESLVPSIALSDLGVEALARGRSVVATEALMTLESLTWPTQPLRGDAAAGYLGLVAHFWARGGAARWRALQSLGGVEFASSASDCLEQASRTHRDATRFETADLLATMAEDSAHAGERKIHLAPLATSM
jgi:hypothetical protein